MARDVPERASDDEVLAPTKIPCLRCKQPMEYAGVKQGNRDWIVLLSGLPAAVDRAHYDFYFCKVCGKVEFFLQGIGEERRG